MTPVSFGDGCFGWLHPGSGRRGAVLCGAFGHEALGTHRGWLELAERLAAQGLHVVRFDYHGTGDSAGGDTDPDRLPAWRATVVAAAALLLQTCGVTSFALVGLRLGATLAMLTATELDGVDALVLLAPVVSGRSFLREQRLLARTWHESSFGTEAPVSRDAGLDVAGWRLEPEAVAALGAIDLRTMPFAAPRALPVAAPRALPAAAPGALPAAAPRALIMDDDTRPEAAALAARLAASGCAVTRLAFPGRAEFLREPVTAQPPRDAFATLCSWIGAGDHAADCATCPPPAEITLPGATEQPVCFGPGRQLFGVLCLPHAPRADRPAVLMVNTGYSHHVGDARLLVLLARRLAAEGITSLRMDVAGIGDSVLPPGSPATLLYDIKSCDDVIAALDLLERDGLPRASVVGICSGAFLAFHAALADPRIVELDLVNLQQFVWARDQPLTVESRRPRRPAGFYAAALLRRRTWREVLHGRVDVGGVLLALLRRPYEHAWRRVAVGIEALGWRDTRAGQVHRWFRALASRGVEVRLWYGDADPGWSELVAQFGRAGHGLSRFPGTSVAIVAGADHALHEPDARARFLRLICDKMVDRREAPAPTPSGAADLASAPCIERRAGALLDSAEIDSVDRQARKDGRLARLNADPAG